MTQITEAVTRFRFYKTKDNSWYIDLPDWTGEPGELQMVAGADDFLDQLSEEKNEVVLEISTQPAKGFEILELVNKQNYGGEDYILTRYKNSEVNKKMWLCDVTKFIFNDFPHKIYFKKV